MTNIEECFCSEGSVFSNPEMQKFLPRIKPTSPLDERLEKFNSKLPELSSFQPGSLGSSSSNVGKRFPYVPTLYEQRVNFPARQNEAVLRCVDNYLGRDEQRDIEEILAPEPKKKPEIAEPIIEPEQSENALATVSIPTEPESINMALIAQDDAPPLKRQLAEDSEESPAKMPTRKSIRVPKPKEPLPYDEILDKAVVLDDYDSDEEDFSDLEYETSAPKSTVTAIDYDEPEGTSEVMKIAIEKKRREIEAKKNYGFSELKIGDMPSIQRLKKYAHVEQNEVFKLFKEACEQAMSEVAAETFGDTPARKPPALIKALMESAKRVLLVNQLRSEQMLKVQLMCWKYTKIEYFKQAGGWKIELSRPQSQFKKLPATWTIECDEDAAIAIQYLHTALYPYPFILESVRNAASTLLQQNSRLKTAPQLCDALRQNDVRVKNWFVQWCVQAVLAGIPEFSLL
jgi:hypothetical protein